MANFVLCKILVSDYTQGELNSIDSDMVNRNALADVTHITI